MPPSRSADPNSRRRGRLGPRANAFSRCGAAWSAVMAPTRFGYLPLRRLHSTPTLDLGMGWTNDSSPWVAAWRQVLLNMRHPHARPPAAGDDLLRNLHVHMAS